MITGYREPEELPFRPGVTVRIKRGTQLHSYPKGAFQAERNYTVRVHHILPGMSLTVGHTYKDDSGVEHRVYTGNTESDLLHYCRTLGISTRSTSAAIEELYARAREVPSRWGRRMHTNLIVDVSNPEVRWAGSGGYWVWADINDVEVVQDDAQG